jgi:anti-anti-sigma factor
MPSYEPSYRVATPHPGAAVMSFFGEHDVLNTEEMGLRLARLIEEHALVVADLSETEFIDSSFVSMLLRSDRLARRRGTTFRLQFGSTAIVHRVLTMTRVTDRIECAATREEALAPATDSPSELEAPRAMSGPA